MKDWKFVKTGNTDTPESRERLRDIEEQIKNWEHGKEVKGVNKENAKKIIEDLRKERATIKSEIATGNESIDKQEWSMFKGLTKDAEKEIGNETPDEMEVKYKGYTITYFPYQKKYMVRHPNEVSGLVQKHFTSVDEAKKAIDKKAIGNESVKETNISGKNGSGVITRMNNLYFVAYNLSNGEKGIEKFQTESQAKDFLKKKVGNAKRYMSGDAIKVTLPGGRVIQAIVTKDEGNVIKYVTKIDDDGNPIGSEQIALRSEVGNATIDYSVITTKDGYFVFKKNEKVGGPFQTEEQAKAFAARLQTKDPQWTNAKTGNEETKAERKFGKVMGEFEEGALKTPQGKTVTDPAQAKAIAYSEADKVDNLKRARNAMKTGNEYKKSDATKDIAEYKRKMDAIDREITRLKAKRDSENDERIQSQIDDKIDELAEKLGYLESDIAEARKAMNKKVKNSSVREYKDSQGRIAQIDFNSDGTDADMAIYEDEKMSKSVEQRNFSTIRDAEQYVQSHGFRRVM